MAKKMPISADRFSVEETPLYKRAAGVAPVKEEMAEPPVVEKTPSKPKKRIVEKDLEQCSLRLRTDQVETLGIQSAKTRENVSSIVRDALEAYLSDYFADKTVNLRISFEAHQTAVMALETKGIRLTPRLIEAVAVVAAANRVDRSEIVRNAIDEFLNQKDAK